MSRVNKFRLRVGETQYSVSVSEMAYGLYDVKVDDESFRISIADLMAASVPVEQAAKSAQVSVPNTGTAASGEGALKSAMPGTVMAIKKNVGDTVSPGDVILTLETMKMENPIKSNRAGRIKEICVKPGKFVNVGETLLVID